MERADVVVVGGGVIGLAVAWRLAEAGRQVVVLDPAPGSGASYAAAGMLAPVAEAVFGEDDLLALNVAAAAAWPGFAAELEAAAGQAVGYEAAGTLLVALEAADRSHLQDLHAYHERLGLASRWCGPSACRSLEPALSPGLHAGVLAEVDARVDNRRLLAALVEACRRAGVVLEERSVEALAPSPSGIGGVVVDGEVRHAELVVLAAGHASALPGLPEGFTLPVRPVKGQILRLRTRDGDPLLERTVHAYLQGTSVYLVPRGDGRIVAGATSEEQGEDVSTTAAGVHRLLHDAITVLPALEEAELVEATARLRPGSPDNAPLLGPLPGVAGLFLATGHYRNGILLAPLTAELALEVLRSGVAA